MNHSRTNLVWPLVALFIAAVSWFLSSLKIPRLTRQGSELIDNQTKAKAIARNGMIEPNEIAFQMDSACRTLSDLTAIGEEQIDASGVLLPVDFKDRLDAMESGKIVFEEVLQEAGQAAFKSVKKVIKDHSRQGLIEVIISASRNQRPSMFDVWLLLASSNYLGEHPTKELDIISEKQWQSVSDSKNPVYRLLALSQGRHLTSDESHLLSFYSTFTDESDELILKVLIERLLTMKTNSSAETLEKIRAQALQRGDKKMEAIVAKALGEIR